MYKTQKSNHFLLLKFQILVLKICKTLKKGLTVVIRFKLLIFV